MQYRSVAESCLNLTRDPGAPGVPSVSSIFLSCKKIIKLTINEELALAFLERGRKVKNSGSKSRAATPKVIVVAGFLPFVPVTDSNPSKSCR